MTRFHFFFTLSQSHGQHINLLCRAACWTSSLRPKKQPNSLRQPFSSGLTPHRPFSQGLGTRRHIPASLHARIPASSPAHDLVCQQDPTHLGVLVLPFVDDGLRRGERRAEVRTSSRPTRTAANGRGVPGGQVKPELSSTPGADPGTGCGVRMGASFPPPHPNPNFQRSCEKGKGKKKNQTPL